MAQPETPIVAASLWRNKATLSVYAAVTPARDAATGAELVVYQLPGGGMCWVAAARDFRERFEPLPPAMTP